MTSLMQGFSRARQVRQIERERAVNELNEWRKQRNIKFQQEALETRAILVDDTKKRRESEQTRLSNSRIEQVLRTQEAENRAANVQLELQQIANDRFNNSQLDAAVRLKQEQERLATAASDQKQRQQELADLKTQTQEFLESSKTARLVMAANLKQELADYASYVHLSVWGKDFSDVLAESRIESAETSYSVGALEGIDDFIQNYVIALPGNPSLVQVVNDRDVVKGLLTSAASTLKVDPSEVLNVLIKMVDLDN